MNADGRGADVDALTAMYADAGSNCDSNAISNANFNAEAWTWPGSFDFNALDTALGNFYDCANAAAVIVSLIF